MNKTQKLLVWLVLLTLVRLMYLTLNHRPLNVDEAQYWLWSRHLAWGYHSKPPVIAVSTWLSTYFLGNDYLGVRFFMPICYFVTSVFLYISVLKLYNQKIAWWTAITFACLPSVTFSGTILSTDPWMLTFWSIGLCCLVYALKTQRAIYWLLMGVSVGLSVMSKYTGFVFIISLFIYLCVDEKQRFWFKKWPFYASLLVTLACVTPNIIWNSWHGFPTVKHVITHNIHIPSLHFHVISLLRFIMGQLLVFSLILFPVLVMLCFRWKTSLTNTWQRLLLSFTLPMLMIILIEALLARAYINWAAAAYLSGTVCCVVYLVKKDQIHWLKLNLIVSMLLIFVFYTGELLLVHHQLPGIKNLRLYRDSAMWSTLAPELQKVMAKYPQANYLFDTRKAWSITSYYARLPLNRVYFWSEKYEVGVDVYTSLQNKINEDFVFITFDKSMSTDISTRFSRVKLLENIQGKLRIYQLIQFKGILKK